MQLNMKFILFAVAIAGACLFVVYSQLFEPKPRPEPSDVAAQAVIERAPVPEQPPFDVYEETAPSQAPRPTQVESDVGSTQRTDAEVKRVAGWGDASSEFFNMTLEEASGHLQTWYDSRAPMNDYIGAVSWHMAMRAAARTNATPRPLTLEDKYYDITLQHVVFSSMALDSAAPVRMFVESYMAGLEDYPHGLGIAMWAMENFDDESARIINHYADTRRRMAAEAGLEVTDPAVTSIIDHLNELQYGYLNPD